MKGYQKNTVKMIRAISAYLNSNIDVIESSVPIMTTKALFDQKFADLIDHFIIQYQDNTGYAIDKKQKRKAVEEKTLGLSAALCAYASINGNFTLLNESRFTVTTLKTISTHKLDEITTNLIINLEQYLPNLHAYGVDSQKIYDFKKSIAVFTESINKPIENIKIRHRSTITIAKLLPEISNLLKGNLDYNIRALGIDFPSFVSEYFKIRRIGKTPRKSLDLVVKTISSSSQEAIEKAKVQIIDTKISRFSGKKGRNIFMDLKAGQYQLLVTHPDYEATTIDFTIVDKETTTLVVALENKARL
jgi:transcription antitermination factor NusA-like protein